MPTIDQYKILTGTLEKRFALERKKMATDYDKDSAEDFFYVYKDAPLSFILQHSREIFSETYHGYPFYLDLISNGLLDPTYYQSECKKVEEYIAKAVNMGLPKHQVDKYYTLQELLHGLNAMTLPFVHVLDLVRRSDNGEEFLQVFFDAAHDVELEYKKFADDEDCLRHVDIHCNYVAEAAFTNSSPYAAIALGFLMLSKYHARYSSQMVDLIERYLNPIADPDLYGMSRRALHALKKLGKTEFVRNVVADTGNIRLIELVDNICRASIDDLLLEPSRPHHDIVAVQAPSVEGLAIGAVTAIMESMEHDFETICSRYDNYRYRAAQLEADLEFMGDYGSLTKPSDITFYESVSLLQNTCEEEMLMLEWEDDGTPNKTISKHIMTTKERAAAKEAEQKEKKSPINNLVQDNQKAEESACNEETLCKEIKHSIETARNLVPADEGEEKKRNDEILAGLRDDLSRYKKLVEENEFPEAKKLINELKEEILSSDQTVTETFHDPELDQKLQEFLEEGEKLKEDSSDGEFKDGPKAVRKPKKDLPTKIQNKALDYAAKDAEKTAKKTADRQKLKNAANAVSQKPKRIGNDMESFVKKIDKWDENRRKEFLLKPGYRHKIFKYMRDALMFGAVAKVKLAYIPMLALLKHCSNLKDKRIRNELAKELDAEIRICEEKISDANGAGDNKSKYELMRIKDKLEAEKTRVRLNSKFI